MTMTANQCRAARALLRWTQQDLADASEVGITAIRVFEMERVEPRRVTINALKAALEKAGIEFIAKGGRTGVVLKSD